MTPDWMGVQGQFPSLWGAVAVDVGWDHMACGICSSPWSHRETHIAWHVLILAALQTASGEVAG